MKLYQNIMETLVEEVYEDMKEQLNCCTCEQCHADIVAYALNHLPPQYAVSQAGINITKAKNLRHQHLTDITAALVNAATLVGKAPRHSV